MLLVFLRSLEFKFYDAEYCERLLNICGILRNNEHKRKKIIY